MDEVEEQVTERKGDKSQVEEGFQYHRAFLLLYAGPADTVDGNWDGSTSDACSPLMPCPGVISGSWRPIPSRRVTWRTSVLVSGHTGSRQHSDHTSVIVGDVSSLE